MIQDEKRIRKDWKDWLWERYSALEETAGEILPVSSTGEFWERELERLFVETWYPRFNFSQGAELNAYRLGYLLGSSDVKAVWARKFIYGECDVRNLPSSIPHVQRDMIRDWLKGFDEFFDGLRKLTKQAFCKSVDQTYDEMAEFHRGFSKGFLEIPFGPYGSINQRLGDTYFLLLVAAPMVRTFQSITQVHQFIANVQGIPAAGDKSRTEKICQRIGLRLGKRGRPRKSVIQKK